MNFRTLLKYWRTDPGGRRDEPADVDHGTVRRVHGLHPAASDRAAGAVDAERPRRGRCHVRGGRQRAHRACGQACLFISGNSINIERWIGTLESLVGLPTPFEVIVVGKNLGNVLQSLVAMIFGYLVAALFFGYSLTIQQPLLFAISVLFTIVGFVSFGLIIAPIFVMNPAVQGWQNAMEFPVYVLCGFLFPIALLPGWTTPISYLLPPYWAAVALHGTSTGGASLQETALAWGMLLLVFGGGPASWPRGCSV